jgi:hypothetical protein
LEQFPLKTNLISTRIANNSIGPARCRFAEFVEALGPTSEAEMVKTILFKCLQAVTQAIRRQILKTWIGPGENEMNEDEL